MQSEKVKVHILLIVQLYNLSAPHSVSSDRCWQHCPQPDLECTADICVVYMAIKYAAACIQFGHGVSPRFPFVLVGAYSAVPPPASVQKAPAAPAASKAKDSDSDSSDDSSDEEEEKKVAGKRCSRFLKRKC